MTLYYTFEINLKVLIKKMFLLIKAYKKMGLKSYEIAKYHIFIKERDLKNFKKGRILWVKLKYKAQDYTKVYIKVQK